MNLVELIPHLKGPEAIQRLFALLGVSTDASLGVYCKGTPATDVELAFFDVVDSFSLFKEKNGISYHVLMSIDDAQYLAAVLREENHSDEEIAQKLIEYHHNELRQYFK